MNSKFLHLSLAFRKLDNPEGQGLCFHHSAALVLDLPGSDLVIGNVHGGGERMMHAWVEHIGMVYAPSLARILGRAGPIVPTHYYEANDARDVSRLPHSEVATLMRSIGYQAFLRADLPMRGRPLPAVILDAAGCQWEDDSCGGIIPSSGVPIGKARG